MAAVEELVSALVQLSLSDGDHEAAWREVVHFCASRWDIPVVLTVAYLAMVYATHGTIGEHGFARTVDRSFAAWNLALSLFSTWGTWIMSQGVFSTVRREGLFFSVCGETQALLRYSNRSPTALALALFCLSKIPELGNTVFLILKRRPVRMLQWYHHTSVMLFGWLALATEYTPGLWFAVTNYFVHSIMYMYFFLMTFKRAAKIVKRIAPTITVIQLAQTVWGLIINGVAVGSYFRTGNCQIRAVTVHCAIIMYVSYFWLFSAMLLESRRVAGRRGESVARTVSRKLSQVLLQEGDGDHAGTKKLN